MVNINVGIIFVIFLFLSLISIHTHTHTHTHSYPLSSFVAPSWPSSISTGLGPMEPDQATNNHYERKKAEPEDSPPKQSLECLQYLKQVQGHQVRMLAIRVSCDNDYREREYTGSECCVCLI